MVEDLFTRGSASKPDRKRGAEDGPRSRHPGYRRGVAESNVEYRAEDVITFIAVHVPSDNGA